MDAVEIKDLIIRYCNKNNITIDDDVCTVDKIDYLLKYYDFYKITVISNRHTNIIFHITGGMGYISNDKFKYITVTDLTQLEQRFNILAELLA
jgi:hypothetical protein